MFKRILLPLDRTPPSERAIEPALSIALAADAKLDVVMVRDPALWTEISYPGPRGELVPDEHYLRSIMDRLKKAGLTAVSSALLDGPIAVGIVERARSTAADLIVITSHFRTGISRGWNGSIADEVLRSSSLPVLMLRTPSREHPASPRVGTGISRILVPLDGSEASEAILPAVRSLAKCCRSRIDFVRVVQPVSPAVASAATASAIGLMGMTFSAAEFENAERITHNLQREAKATVDRVVAEFVSSGFSRVSGTVVTEHNVSDAIVQHAAEQQSDLIAMTTHGRGASRLVIGSLADRIMRDSALPILLQRPSAADIERARKAEIGGAAHHADLATA